MSNNNIIVKPENQNKINALFDSVQKRCTVRVADYDLVSKVCASVEKRVGISKRALEGTRFDYDFRQTFPSAYKYTPDSTHFTCVYHSNKWYLLPQVHRYTCPNSASYYQYKLMLSDTAKAAVLAKYE